jgi:hypothetical protein
MVMALEGRTLLSTWTVTKAGNDDGSSGTLSWAVGKANADGGGDTIAFDANVFATPQQIALNNTLVLTGTAGATTITGPAAGVSVGTAGPRDFQINPGVTASISGLTITGGGLLDSFGKLTLTNCTISQSYATNGGALAIVGGTATLIDCTVSGNTASADGGGLNVSGTLSNPGTVTLLNCTVSGNRAYNGGGLFIDQYGGATLTNCTVSGNSASPRFTNHGGGLFNLGTVTLTNCTISGTYGGLYNAGTATLTNTIVAGNGGDIANFGTVSGNYNLIGDGSGISGGTGNLTGDPMLAPLGDYGGPTQTMALLPGSPAIGAGTADGAPNNDQRNEPRIGHVDIGAFQSQGFTLTPAAGSTPQSAVTGAGFTNPLTVMVTAANKIEPVNGGVISFMVPASGASATLSAATVVIANGTAGVKATANNTMGAYTVTASANGAGSASFALTNTEAASLVLTTTRDVVDQFDGLTSLREAIAYANSHPGPDTIILDPPALGSKSQTIRLTGGPLVLTDPATTTIIGPGARRLTLSGGGRSRVFDIEGGSLDLSGVTIAGGKAARGGGVLNEGGQLALTDVVIHGNRARMGGGLYNDGRTTFSGVTINGNRALIGGNVFNTTRATLHWRRTAPAHQARARVSGASQVFK